MLWGANSKRPATAVARPPMGPESPGASGCAFGSQKHLGAGWLLVLVTAAMRGLRRSSNQRRIRFRSERVQRANERPAIAHNPTVDATPAF